MSVAVNDQERLERQKLTLQSALEYARIGLPIIPLCPPDHAGMNNTHRSMCKSPGKTPLIRDWTHKSSTAGDEVKAWFNKNPNLNVGLVLGNADEFNLVGIDVDGPEGEQILQEMSKGVLPNTWEFTTGKGRRLIYALPEGAESKKSTHKGMEKENELALLASGQQTVMPPSVHATGRLYEWLPGKSPWDADIADAPQWLLNRVLLTDTAEGEVPPQTVSTDDWNKKVQQGERNNHLTKLAGSLIARRNIPKEQILAFVQTWNRTNCDPPLPDDEIQIMVENLHRSEQVKAAKFKKKKEESGNALRPTPFAEQFLEEQKRQGKLWMFDVDKGVFYFCDEATGPWTMLDTVYLHREIREELIKHDVKWDSTRHISEVVASLKEILSIDHEEGMFDMGVNADIDHIYVNNGLLDWRTLETKPWDPSTFSTLKLKVDWKADAKNSEEYKYWQNILRQWLPDEETITFLQEYVGYCLVPDCSFRTAVFLYGGGSNGKSLFLDVVSKLFGEFISFVPLHWIGERFESAKLIDKLANICGDIDSKYMTETATLKAMIAGDPIRAEYKHGKSFHFHPVARLMFSANTLPKSSDKSEGWYSRWRFIEFPHRFPTDTKFKRELLSKMTTQAGLEALLHWSVEGLQSLYNVGSFTESEDMEQAANQYRMENDSVQAFFGLNLFEVVHSGAATQMVVPSLYSVYKQWCEDVGVKATSLYEFTRRMTNLGIKKSPRVVKGISSNCLLGVKFTTAAEEAGYIDEYNLHESIRVSTAKKRKTS